MANDSTDKPAKKNYTVTYRDGTTETVKGTLADAIKAAQATGRAFRSIHENE
jgi:hypothetical protein